jgi:hypothetical protein
MNIREAIVITDEGYKLKITRTPYLYDTINDRKCRLSWVKRKERVLRVISSK